MNGISEDEILTMLQSMVKQRHESAALYEKGGRRDLVDQERGEVTVIEQFLPAPFSDEETATAVEAAVAELKAASLKDMGPVMAMLRQRFPGRMDFAKASALVKERLG